jgi:Protein of unknown function with HXXEE motif
MTMTTLAWLGMAAYAAHVLEEYTLDWRGWSRTTLNLPVEWRDFYVTNCIVVALGIAQAALAATLPLATLSYAALMLINGVLMHITPFVRSRGHFSPGVVTATLFFVPLGVAMFWTAWTQHLAGPVEMVLAFVIGGATLAFPIGMLMLRSLPYFRQDAHA